MRILTKGVYKISLDGGVSWIKSDNMLVSGYFNHNLNSMTMKLGIGNNLESYQDTDINEYTQAGSQSSSGFSESKSVNVDDDKFYVKKSQVFNFGVGHNFSLSEIGLFSGSTLFSRTIIKDDNGTPISIAVTEVDDLIIRYEISYKIPRQKFNVSLVFLEEERPAKLYFCNPNQWGELSIGQPISISGAGISHDTEIGDDGYLTICTVNASIRNAADQRNEVNTNDKRIYTSSFFAGLNDLNGEFKQILLSKGSTSLNTVVAVIDFDEPITKTEDDTLSFSISIVQEGIDGDT